MKKFIVILTMLMSMIISASLFAADEAKNPVISDLGVLNLPVKIGEPKEVLFVFFSDQIPDEAMVWGYAVASTRTTVNASYSSKKDSNKVRIVETTEENGKFKVIIGVKVTIMSPSKFDFSFTIKNKDGKKSNAIQTTIDFM